MVSTEKILKSAAELGKLIAEHESTRKFEAVAEKLQQDTDAQRLLTDYNRQMALMQEKEAKNEPIEVADKHKLEQLQNGMIQHALLRDLQMVQMDYLDLMRRVDEAIQGPKSAGRGDPQAAQSPIGNPDLDA